MNLPLSSAAVLLALILPPLAPRAQADDAGETFEEAIEHLTEAQDQSLGAALAALQAACGEPGGEDDCRVTSLRAYLLRYAGSRPSARDPAAPGPRPE